jgi:hypothetical protein
MNRPAVIWLAPVLILAFTACKREIPDSNTAPSSTVKTESAPALPSPPKDLPSSWPTGEAVTLTLTPDTGGTSLTKALYERGDIVLEQTWPDGTRERWWHTTDGSIRYIGRDGNERVEKAL